VRSFQKTWSRVQSLIDKQRAGEVEAKLKIQAHDAVWWRDACLLYFQTFSKLPIPAELEQPVSKLDSLMQIKLDMKHIN
jgi:alpha-glucuronidase